MDKKIFTLPNMVFFMLMLLLAGATWDILRKKSVNDQLSSDQTYLSNQIMMINHAIDISLEENQDSLYIDKSYSGILYPDYYERANDYVSSEYSPLKSIKVSTFEAYEVVLALQANMEFLEYIKFKKPQYPFNNERVQTFPENKRSLVPEI